MKNLIKRWLFKADVDRIDWYLAKRKDELERRYQDRENYLEQKYAMIDRENRVLHARLSEIISFTPGKPFIVSKPTVHEGK